MDGTIMQAHLDAQPEYDGEPDPPPRRDCGCTTDIECGPCFTRSRQRFARQQCKADTEPLTIAVRVCARCKTFMGVAEWRGKDAHPGEPWCETNGICDECLAKQEREMEEVA